MVDCTQSIIRFAWNVQSAFFSIVSCDPFYNRKGETIEILLCVFVVKHTQNVVLPTLALGKSSIVVSDYQALRDPELLSLKPYLSKKYEQICSISRRF